MIKKIQVIFKLFYSNPRNSFFFHSLLSEKTFFTISFFIYFTTYNLFSVPAWAIASENLIPIYDFKAPNYIIYIVITMGFLIFTYLFTNPIEQKKAIYRALIYKRNTYITWGKLSITQFVFVPLNYIIGFPVLFIIFAKNHDFLSMKNILYASGIGALTGILLTQIILTIELSKFFYKKNRVSSLGYFTSIITLIAIYSGNDITLNGFRLLYSLILAFIILSFCNILILKKCSFYLK